MVKSNSLIPLHSQLKRDIIIVINIIIAALSVKYTIYLRVKRKRKKIQIYNSNHQKKKLYEAIISDDVKITNKVLSGFNKKKFYTQMLDFLKTF